MVGATARSGKASWTRTREKEPPRNPLRRIASLRPPSDAEADRLQQKIDRLDALADSTTFDGERAAAERVATPLRARLEAIVEAIGEPKSAILCDDCARLLSFAIDDPLGEDMLRGKRFWAGAEKSCDRCWATMRAEA